MCQRLLSLNNYRGENVNVIWCLTGKIAKVLINILWAESVEISSQFYG